MSPWAGRWPLDVGRQSGAPAVRPVGLLAAVWTRNRDVIELRVEADDVLVNPDATTALWAGQTVIVASKNHQALDAVEQRLSGIAPRASFLVRTLDPARDVDRGMVDVLHDLVSEPAGRGVAGPESDVAAELNRRANARVAAIERITTERRLRLQLAEDLERLESRQLAGLPETPATEAGPSASGFWWRLLGWLGFARGRETPDVDDGTIPTEALRRRIYEARAHLAELGPIVNPVTLTQEIATLALQVLGRHVAALSAPDEKARLALSNAHDDLQLQGEKAPGRQLAESVLVHRPLWLASVLGAPRRIPLEDGLFDLAIFDEASQCDIGSALPLRARARRAVIVGDDRQLAFIPQLGIAQDRNLMSAQRLSTRWKLACCSLARFCSRARTEAATFLGSRAIGDHRFQIGPQNGPDAGIPGVSNDLRRFDLAGPHDIVETFERDIETDVLPESKAIDDCLGWIEDRHRHAVDGVGLHAEGKRSRSEPHNSGRGIVDLGLSRSWTDGEPDAARCLEREIVELKGGDKADDSFGYKLGDLGEIMRCRDFGVGELVEPAGDAGQDAVLEHARERFRVDPGVAEFDATHGAARLEKGDGPIPLRCRGCGRHVTKRRSIG